MDDLLRRNYYRSASVCFNPLDIWWFSTTEIGLFKVVGVHQMGTESG
jgi:hypothetical protein